MYAAIASAWLSSVIAAAPAGSYDRLGLRYIDPPAAKPEEIDRFHAELRRALSEVSGAMVTVDEEPTATEPTVEEVARHTRARTAVLADLAFGATQGRLSLSLGRLGEGVLRRVQVDFPLEALSWSTVLPGAIHVLLAEPLRTARGPAPPPAPAVVERASPVPAYVAIGAGVAMAAAATALRLAAESSRDEAEMLERGEERAQVEDRALTQGLVSNVGFGGAAALLTGGLVYLLTRP